MHFEAGLRRCERRLSIQFSWLLCCIFRFGIDCDRLSPRRLWVSIGFGEDFGDSFPER